MSEENVNKELNEILANVDSETKGERYFAKKFKNIYVKTRKVLVFLNKARKNEYEGGSRKEKNGKLVVIRGKLVKESKYTNEETYNLAVETLNAILNE